MCPINFVLDATENSKDRGVVAEERGEGQHADQAERGLAFVQ